MNPLHSFTVNKNASQHWALYQCLFLNQKKCRYVSGARNLGRASQTEHAKKFGSSLCELLQPTQAVKYSSRHTKPHKHTHTHTLWMIWTILKEHIHSANIDVIKMSFIYIFLKDVFSPSCPKAFQLMLLSWLLNSRGCVVHVQAVPYALASKWTVWVHAGGWHISHLKPASLHAH